MNDFLILHGAISERSRSPGDRRWEDLEADCLVNIFERVATESLLLCIPFVCKSWYRASLAPSCYKRLFFPADIGKRTITTHPSGFRLAVSDGDDQSSCFDYFIRRYAREFGIEWSRFSVTKFIKSLVDRSEGNTEFLKIPGICCHYDNFTRDVLENIAKNCKKFKGLHMSHALVDRDTVTKILEFLPNIKYLCLRRAEIDRDDLIMLIKGCKDLEILDVRQCIGFSDRDKDIVRHASHIPKFRKGGSRRNRKATMV